jgi:hypothetical protein
MGSATTLAEGYGGPSVTPVARYELPGVVRLGEPLERVRAAYSVLCRHDYGRLAPRGSWRMEARLIRSMLHRSGRRSGAIRW